MEVREAVVIGTSQRPDGTYELAFEAYCPPNCERLNVMVAGQRHAALAPAETPGDRPQVLDGSRWCA